MFSGAEKSLTGMAKERISKETIKAGGSAISYMVNPYGLEEAPQ